MKKQKEFDTPDGICRQCLCSHYDACWHDEDGNCWWVEPNLCSHCKNHPGDCVDAELLRERKKIWKKEGIEL